MFHCHALFSSPCERTKEVLCRDETVGEGVCARDGERRRNQLRGKRSFGQWIWMLKSTEVLGTTFTFMSCALHAHKGNSAHLSVLYKDLKRNEYGDTKQLRRSQRQGWQIQLKICTSSESSEISIAIVMFLWCLLIRLRKYFSAAWHSGLPNNPKTR